MNSNNMFDIKPLMDDIQEVIQQQIDYFLKQFMDRYNLLEETHKQIMLLPSVANELFKINNSSKCGIKINNDIDVEKNKNININYSNLESRLDKLENSIDTKITPLLINIMNRSRFMSFETNINDEIVATNKITKPNLIDDISDNENIKFQIEENTETENEEDKTEEAVEDEEVLKEEEVDVDTKVVDTKVVDDVVDKDVEEEEEVDDDDDDEEEVTDDDEVEVTDDDEVDDDEVDDDEAVKDEVDDDEAVKDEVDDDEAVEEEAADDEVDDDESLTEEAVDDNISIETETYIKKEEEKEKEDIEEEIFAIEIDDITYCTNDEENGFIWDLTEDGEQGNKIGYLDKGEACFY